MSNKQDLLSPALHEQDAQDALIAAPAHHTLLMENEHVRVLDTRVAPGEAVPLHTHKWASALYIVSWSDFVRRDAEGKVLADSRQSGALQVGTSAWSGPLAPHTLENVGGGELRVISVEVKG